jgi:nicotinate-nucleotide adenylyltransferase
MAGRRVGVLGGTFDPVHIGHLLIGTESRAALDLDVVLLVVAAQPWQKVDRPDLTPAEDRLAVVEAAVDGIAGLEASPLEIERGDELTYTADTLATLRQRDGDDELFLLVGADVAHTLDTWVRPDEIKAAATLVVVGRPGSDPPPVDELRSDGWRVEEVDMPSLEVSSSDVRRRRLTGRPIDVLVPAAAVREIERRGLYARPR